MGRRAGNADHNGSTTVATAVYERMRADIMAGALNPREKLRIELLKSRYQSGASPIREALNRLAAERLVVQHEQRGFSVAPVSLEDFLELTRTRVMVYETAIREAIAVGDDAWEERIVVAMHRMSRTPWTITQDPLHANPEARKAHRELHRALISACGSTLLLDFADSLFEQADRYRLLSQLSESAAKRPVESEHRAIVEATLARDVTRAIRLTTEHIERTAELVKEATHAVELRAVRNASPAQSWSVALSERGEG